MKTMIKKLFAFLIAAICCALAFPMAAFALEPVKMPEKNEITVRFYLEGMNPTPSKPEPIYVTIQSDENGHFSFDYPSLTILDETRHYYFSGMRMEGAAYASDGSSTVQFDNVAEPSPIEKGYYFGDLDVNGLQATLRIDALDLDDTFIEFDTLTFTFEKAFFTMDRHGPDGSPRMNFNMYYRVASNIYDTSGELQTSRIEILPIDFTIAGASGEKDAASGSATTGEWEYYKPEDGGWGFRYNFGGNSAKDAGHAGPLAAISISILAILLSILFGNTGGFIPTAPVGTGGTPAPAPAGSGLSRWMRFDGDGDIETTDPVNGQRRTFVHNSDGTYTDPVSGATYTPEELSEQMEHRADNAGTIRQDEAQFKNNVDEDYQRNQERSDESKQLEEDLQRERQERARREKIERVATELGISGASEDEVRQELARRMVRDEDFRQKMNDYAQRRDTAVDILEATVEAADYGMAIGEVVVPGGKTVSATYKGIKNIGETVMEKGASAGSVVEGVIKGGTEAATTMMDSTIGKAVTNIGGTVAGEIAGAVNDGEDITRAAAEGLVKGAGNATIGAVSDAVGDAAKSTSGKVATKIAETAFGKEVAEPLYDEAFKKDK
ncbi:MAG: hypothetical protein ACOX6L_03010 [Syntrophomonadaceae bacterium]|jgi:hypothetical protein